MNRIRVRPRTHTVRLLLCGLLFCGLLFCGTLRPKAADDNGSNLEAWQVSGLLDGMRDAELEVRAQSLLRLAKSKAIPDEALSSKDVSRTIGDLLNSELALNVRSGLILVALSNAAVQSNQQRIHEILSKSDDEISLLAGQALKSAGLLTADDVPYFVKILGSASVREAGEAAHLLNDSHLLTTDHGRVLASRLRSKYQREASRIVDILKSIGALTDDDGLYLAQQAKLIDPRTDPYRFLDIAEATAEAGRATPELASALEVLLTPDRNGTIDVAFGFAVVKVLNEGGASSFLAFQHLVDELSLADVNATMQRTFILSQSSVGAKMAVPFFRQVVTSDDPFSIYLGLVGLNELGGLRDEDKEPALLLLETENPKAVSIAVTALRALKVPRTLYHDRAMASLNDAEDDGVFLGLLVALTEDHAILKGDVPALLTLLDQKTSPTLQVDISRAICSADKVSPSVVSHLETLLMSSEPSDAASAAFALGQCEAATPAQADILARRMAHLSSNQSSYFVAGLGGMGHAAAGSGPILAGGLTMDNSDNSIATLVARANATALDGDRVQALEKTGPHGVPTLATIFSQASKVQAARPELVALAYELAGHKEPGLTLVSALRTPAPAEHEARIERLRVLLNAWDTTPNSDASFRDQLARVASALVRESSWHKPDAALLTGWIERLKNSQHLDEADTFERVLHAMRS
jgi:hypothetical protein